MPAIEFVTPEEAYEDSDPYTVEIPEGATEEFHPSKHITNEQMIALVTSGKEAYPGLLAEYQAWEDANAELERRQAIADGYLMPEHTMPDLDPDYDPETGREVYHEDEVQIGVDKTGDAYTFEETAEEEK